MSVIRWGGFQGENRAIHPKLLNDVICTVSRNQKPGRGDLRPWKTPLTVATVPAGRKTIYRMGRDVPSDSNYWLSWPGVVHAVRGYDAEDTTERTYFTGDGPPKVTDNTMALSSAPFPTTARPLGLPAPTGAPTVSAYSKPVAVDADAGKHAYTVEKEVVNALAIGDVFKFEFSTGKTSLLTISGSTASSLATQISSIAEVGATVVDGSVRIIVKDGSDTSFKIYKKIGTTDVFELTVQSSKIVSSVTVPLKASYYYAYTYANDWGWESASSPPSAELIRETDAVASISGFSAPPSGNYHIDRIRVYRTQSGSNGSADFFFLREIAIGTTSTSDDNRTLGEAMPTKTWLPAPNDLSCLTPMWNGMLAGISGNSVRICEAYTPYAWPIAYDIVPADSKPVALGVFGQNLLILTTTRPVLAAGSSPDSMDSAPMEFSQGCISAQSVVSMGQGVAWASEDGLCWYGSGGARILTAGIMLREDWQALKPSTIIGRMYEGLYFGSYDDGAGRKGFMLDPNNPAGIYFLDIGYTAAHFDELRDQLYVLDGSNVKKWDTGTAMTVRAVSKVFRSPTMVNFGAAEVVADAYPVTISIYADGVLKHTQDVMGRSPFRLPSGFSAMDWQIEVSGIYPVQGVVLATMMEELAQV